MRYLLAHALGSCTEKKTKKNKKTLYAVNCIEALNYLGSKVSTVERGCIHCNLTQLRVNGISWLQVHCQYPFPQTGFYLVVSAFASRRNQRLVLVEEDVC